MDASSDAWKYYKSGVIGDDDNCGTGINHAVVIVGYTEAGATPPEEDEEEQEQEEEEQEEEQEEEKEEEQEEEKEEE